jgi:flagellar hook-associated protein 2
MGIRLPNASGLDTGKLVEQLVAAEKVPVEKAKQRREKVVEEKAEVEKLQGFLSELDTATNKLKTKGDFYRMKVDSSHPDIMEGVVEGITQVGQYEFEVRGLAKNEKELAVGFPDKDQTPVGFGYMLIERDDKEPMEVVIEPDTTLMGVADQINSLEMGVRAMVVNTKYNPDSFRLLVVSEDSGKEAKITIDTDTTFLEFEEQVTGRNLDVLFEDVPVTDDDNVLDELVEGVKFHLKRSEPGTRIQMNVSYDIDATIEGVKAFVEKYNQIVAFAAEQSKDPRAGDPGKLSGDSSIKTIMRGLQSSLFPPAFQEGKYNTLAEVGITTNPKTGELQLDEAKVRTALTDDYDGVASLFVRTKFGDGVGERISAKLKAFRDSESGVVRARLRGLDRVIENQDKDINRRERQLEEKEASIKRRFSALESQMSGLQAQGNFLAARMGGQGQSQGGGG